jgi:hypothetical protein
MVMFEAGVWIRYIKREGSVSKVACTGIKGEKYNGSKYTGERKLETGT